MDLADLAGLGGKAVAAKWLDDDARAFNAAWLKQIGSVLPAHGALDLATSGGAIV